MIAMALLLAALPQTQPQTQADLTGQAADRARAADAAMNAQYRRTMAQMKHADGYKAPDATTGPSYANALLAAQRAWLAYRDAECLLRGYEFRGGSAQGMARGQCIADLTTARTRALKIEMWQK